MRVRTWMFLLGSLLNAVPGFAQLPDDLAVGSRTQRGDVFPETSAQFPGAIMALPGIEFSNLVGYRPLRLDLYAHADRSVARPLVLWVHGGGWNRGDGRASARYADWPRVLAGLAARGYVVASVDYRLAGEARFPAQVQDVKAAIRFLRANAARYGIDPAHVIVWGGSAGGHLAALAAMTCGMPQFEPEISTGRMERREMAAAHRLGASGAPSDCANALAVWYGIFDLRAFDYANVADLLGCTARACPENASQASPIVHVTPDDPPTLIVHGLADDQAPPDQARAMAAQLRAAKVPVEEFYFPDIGHGWDAANPAVSERAHRTALARTFAFFDAVTHSGK